MPYAERALAEAVDGMRWGIILRPPAPIGARLIDAYPAGAMRCRRCCWRRLSA